jgi:hypothetical protein
MKYASAAALDRAITDVLLRRVDGDGKRYEQLRREVAFERVLARLVAEDPDMWLLKGGVALDYRLHEARSTLDLDLSAKIDIATFQEKLDRAIAIDLGDFFEVQFSGPPSRPVDEVETYRFGLDVRLNNRTFMKVSIDVGFADPWLGDAEALETSEVLAFAGVEPVTVKAISIEQHIAEKVHAYTKSYGSRQNSRVKDLVDLMLLSGHRPIAMTELGTVLDAVFRSRATHELPKSFPLPPDDWRDAYQKLSETLPITSDIDEAHASVAAFLDPVFGTRTDDRWWDPMRRIWIDGKPSASGEAD